MATLSELFVELKLNAESFNNGLKQATREAKEFEKNLKPTLEFTKNIGVAMTAAGAAIVAGMGAAAKSAIDYGDALNDARQRTGATVETLSKLGFAAEQSGSSFEGLSTGLKFLSKNMEAAISKSGDQRAAFNELGISSKDLKDAQGDVNKVLLLVSDRIKELPDGTDKAALAMRVFGKSGADLIPLLNEGSAGIQKLGQDAEKAGLVISQDFASASDELNDTLNEVKGAALGASIGIAEALLPALQTAASLVAEAASKFAAFAKEHPGLIQAVGALGVALVTVGGTLTGIAVIVPKVQAGFLLLQTAAGALGITITATTAGVVALGAAVGVAIGLFINWAIEGTRLQKTLDSFVDGTLKKLGFQWESTSEQQKSAAFTAAAVAKQQKTLNTEIDKAIFVGPKLIKVKVDEAAADKAREKALKDSNDAMEKINRETAVALDIDKKLTSSLTELTKGLFDFNRALDAAAKNEADAAMKLASFTNVTNEAVAAMEQARYNAEEMDKDLASLAHKDPGVQIGKGFETSAAAIRKNTEESKKLDDAIKDVKNSAGKIFDDMFIKGEGVFSSLGNLLKGGALSLGRAIFEDVVGALLGPIKKAFDDFFEGLLESLGVKKFLAGLGNQLGGLLGGVFGGGAGAGGAAGGVGTAGAGAGAGAGVGGLSGAQLGAFFTNPFTIAIGGAIAAAVGLVKSQAHHEANTFVKEFQNPFGQALANISDAFAAAESSGNLTIDAAEEARDQVIALWDTFQKNAREFAKKGSDEAKVVNQAFATLGPLMDKIFKNMNTSISNLTASTNPGALGIDGLVKSMGDLTDATGLITAAVIDAAGGFQVAAQSILELGAALTAGIQGGPITATTTGGTNGMPVVTTISGTIPGTDATGVIPSVYSSPFGNSTVPFPGQGVNQRTPVIVPTIHASSLPSYAEGTRWVPRTGLAMLHQGEAVLPANNKGVGGNGITMNLYQRQESDGEFARRVSDALSRFVDRAGGRLAASEVRR